MSAKVIPLFQPMKQPSLTERLAARRIYRQRCKEMCGSLVARAFTASARGIDIGCDDAVPLFLAAMRRELRKVWP